MKTENRLSRVALVVTLTLTMGGCEVVTKQHVGTGLGGIAGGLAGSLLGSGTGQLIATALGSLAGGLIGSEIGGRLDRADQDKVDSVSFQALEYAPDGETISWVNSENHTGGNMTATQTTLNGTTVCRDFVQSISVKDQMQTANGRACRTTDGGWKVEELAS